MQVFVVVKNWKYRQSRFTQFLFVGFQFDLTSKFTTLLKFTQ